MSRQVVATGDRNAFAAVGRQAGFDRLMRSGAAVRGYADCMGHTLALQGAVAAMADFGIRIWDLAATQVLIEEAGGLYRIIDRLAGPGQPRYCIAFGKPRAVAFLTRFWRNP
jgi:histidinol-phosphatase